MWQRNTATELKACNSLPWEVQSTCLLEGKYYTVSYCLTLAIQIIGGGGEGTDTLADGNLGKYNCKNAQTLWSDAVVEIHISENLQELFSCFLPFYTCIFQRALQVSVGAVGSISEL